MAEKKKRRREGMCVQVGEFKQWVADAALAATVGDTDPERLLPSLGASCGGGLLGGANAVPATVLILPLLLS